MGDEHTNSKKKNWFKRHKKLSITAAIVVVIFIVACIGSSNSNQTIATTTTSDTAASSNNGTASGDSVPLSSGTSTPSSAPSTPGLNQSADDGKFQFTVTSFSCGQTYLQNDNEFENATAQGQFCVMKLAIKGIGTVSQEFDNSAQYVYGSDGTQYSYNSEGTMAANPSGSTCDYATINPGVTQDCNVAFDVPKGVAPTYAMLHDSSLSNGVKVNLQ